RPLATTPRHSQSHSALFESVDGRANHDAVLRIALGEEPEHSRNGQYAFAAKWFLRHFTDGFVRSVPSEDEIERIQQQIPGLHIEIIAQQGQWLSDLHGQDSYSFELADVFVGAGTPEEAERMYQESKDALSFDIQDADRN